MQIKIAKNAGFCFGVNRAMTLVEDALKNKQTIYSLGQLVHNSQLTEKLVEKGFRLVNDMQEVPSGSLFVIRSHGLPKNIIEQLRQADVQLIDATCPFVKKAQQVAEDFYKQEYQVVILGDPEHAEVKAIRSWTDDLAIVIQSSEEVADLEIKKTVGFLSQTTQKKAVFETVEKALREKTTALVVKNTICSDTAKKQEEVAKLAAEVDLMLVIGGKNSSNTTKLAEVSKKTGVATFHIETAEELEVAWFKGLQIIGIAAGASTPQFIIDEVIEKVRGISNKR